MSRPKRDALSKVYRSAPVRGIMTGLPAMLGASGDPALAMVGTGIGSFDAALTAHLANIEGTRAELARQSDGRIEQLRQGGRLDETVLESDEFRAVVFRAALAAAEENDADKVEWYAAILSGAVSRDRPDQLDLRALLTAMTSLTGNEMRLARQFYEDFNQATYSIVDGAPPPAWGSDTGLYLRHLENANLIVPRAVAGLPSGFQGQSGNYFVTDTFHRLMNLVNQTKAET